jgi:hypothetical protein
MSNQKVKIKRISMKTALAVLAFLFAVSIGHDCARAQENKAVKTSPKMKAAATKPAPRVKTTETKSSTVAHKAKSATVSAKKKSKKKTVDDRTMVSDEAKEREANARTTQQRQAEELRAEKAKRTSEQAGGKTLEHKGATLTHKAKIENSAKVQPPHPVKKDSLNN